MQLTACAPRFTPVFINFLISLICKFPKSQQQEFDQLLLTQEDEAEKETLLFLFQITANGMRPFAESLGFRDPQGDCLWSVVPYDLLGEIHGAMRWMRANRFDRADGIGIRFMPTPGRPTDGI